MCEAIEMQLVNCYVEIITARKTDEKNSREIFFFKSDFIAELRTHLQKIYSAIQI